MWFSLWIIVKYIKQKGGVTAKSSYKVLTLLLRYSSLLGVSSPCVFPQHSTDDSI